MQLEIRRNTSTQRRREDVRGTQRDSLSAPTRAGCPMLSSAILSTFAPRFCVEKSGLELKRRNISTQRRREDVRGTQRDSLSAPTGAGCPMLPSASLSTFALRLCVEQSRLE